LQVELNINPIQFPRFEFEGIDAKIEHQQQVFTKGTERKETGRKSRCCNSDEVYYAMSPLRSSIPSTRLIYAKQQRQSR
jgi:hypothetical protein